MEGVGTMIDRASLLAAGDEIGGTVRTRRFLMEARERLDDVARLPYDWDSYGAAQPAVKAITIAQALLAALWERRVDAIDQTAVPWAIAPLADGGVQFEWRSGDGAI